MSLINTDLLGGLGSGGGRRPAACLSAEEPCLVSRQGGEGWVPQQEVWLSGWWGYWQKHRALPVLSSSEEMWCISEGKSRR